MTWVCGCATDFIGTAICVADIQVTLSNGQAFDCLRKVYAVDQNVVAGFAGDVEIGFAMLTELSRLVERLRSGREEPVDMQRAFRHFPGIARRAFQRAPIRNRESGSEILIGGASLAPDRIYESEPFAARFRWPEFKCESLARGVWGSIGSGSAVEPYRQALEDLTKERGEDESHPVTMEAGWPGGYASIMFISLLGDVARLEPVPGVSGHFHSIIATAHGLEGHNSDRIEYPAVGNSQEIRMPPVAESFAELQQLLRTRLGAVPAWARA